MLAVTATGATGHEPSIGLGPLHICGAGEGFSCRSIEVGAIDLADPITHIRQTVDVPAAVAASRLPLAVTLVGTMSSEISWNGSIVGRNGVAGVDAAHETPGLFHVVVPVPREVVRVGLNVVDIRMSGHHRWPVRIPVQQIGVGYYTGPASGEIGAYWPALLTAGALLLAAFYFSAAALLGHARRDALLLGGVALSALLQLAIETSRSVVIYAYPVHVLRISAIVVMVSLTAALMVGYVACRFAPRRGRMAVAAVTSVSILAIVFVQSFDAKAWVVLFGAALICLACALHARRRRDGKVAIALAVLFGAMLVWTRQDALDHGYYLFLALILGALLIEQVVGQRRLHAGLTAERERANSLAESLATAGVGSASIISFRDGSRIHQVAEGEIIRITAADDFCEIVVKDRRPMLVGGTLKSLVASLPDRFLRIHKSHVVNMVHVTSIVPKSGGGHQVVHADGSTTPVGRTYRDVLVARFK